jgi:hypothetical protein
MKRDMKIFRMPNSDDYDGMRGVDKRPLLELIRDQQLGRLASIPFQRFVAQKCLRFASCAYKNIEIVCFYSASQSKMQRGAALWHIGTYVQNSA